MYVGHGETEVSGDLGKKEAEKAGEINKCHGERGGKESDTPCFTSNRWKIKMRDKKINKTSGKDINPSRDESGS